MKRRALILALPALLAACDDKPETAEVAVVPGATPPVAPAPLPAGFPPRPGEPGGLPVGSAPTTPAEAADPKSAGGAAEVVRRYFALIGEKKFDDARQLVGPTPPDLKTFERRMSFYPLYRANVGKPGAVKGAADSSYVEVPIQTYGRNAAGELFNRLETVQLRRANDAPGATPETLSWRIYQITVDR